MARILVTGSSNGLGKEIVKALNEAGHDVIGYDIADGCDVRTPDPAFIEQLDTLDILINNAAVNKIEWLENFSEADWDRIISTNERS